MPKMGELLVTCGGRNRGVCRCTCFNLASGMRQLSLATWFNGKPPSDVYGLVILPTPWDIFLLLLPFAADPRVTRPPVDSLLQRQNPALRTPILAHRLSTKLL